MIPAVIVEKIPASTVCRMGAAAGRTAVETEAQRAVCRWGKGWPLASFTPVLSLLQNISCARQAAAGLSMAVLGGAITDPCRYGSLFCGAFSAKSIYPDKWISKFDSSLVSVQTLGEQASVHSLHV